MSEEKYPKIKVLKSLAETHFDTKTGESYTTPAEYEYREPNRIALPIEQDIVNINTSFVVGTEPTLTCLPATKAKRVYSLS